MGKFKSIATLTVVFACAVPAVASAATLDLTASPSTPRNTGTSQVTATVTYAVNEIPLATGELVTFSLPSGSAGTISPITAPVTAVAATPATATTPMIPEHAVATTKFTSTGPTGRSIAAMVTVKTTKNESVTASNLLAFGDAPPSISSVSFPQATGLFTANASLGASVLGASALAPACGFSYTFNGGAASAVAGILNATNDGCTGQVPGPLANGTYVVISTVQDLDMNVATRTDTFTYPIPAGAPAPGVTDDKTTINPGSITNPLTPVTVAPVNANDVLLGCGANTVAITDISKRSGRVRILGVASPSAAGTAVRIAYRSATSIVATATVAADGSFRATAPLPSKKVAASDATRFRATLNGKATPWLKYSRRLVVSGIHAVENTDLGIGGTLTKPLIKGAQVTITSQTSCTEAPKVIGHITVESDGLFSRTLAMPATATGLVVKLTAKVRSSSGRSLTTYSIARPVQIR